jgi:hypothetical protein
MQSENISFFSHGLVGDSSGMYGDDGDDGYAVDGNEPISIAWCFHRFFCC